MPNDVEPPEGFEMGSVDDAIADDSSTTRVWVTNDDEGVAYWFDLVEKVPLRKKNSVLEDNLTIKNGDPNLSGDYFIDLLEYMIRDWFGADEPDAPGLRAFLTQMGTEFEDLQDEVPDPFTNIDEDDLGK